MNLVRNIQTLANLLQDVLCCVHNVWPLDKSHLSEWEYCHVASRKKNKAEVDATMACLIRVCSQAGHTRLTRQFYGALHIEFRVQNLISYLQIVNVWARQNGQQRT